MVENEQLWTAWGNHSMTHAYISGCLKAAYSQYQYSYCCQDAAPNVDLSTADPLLSRALDMCWLHIHSL